MEIPVENIDKIMDITLRDQNGDILTYNLKEELQIHRDNLQEDFTDQPVKYAYWVSILEKVRLYLESATLELEKVQASLYEPCRNSLIDAGTPKPTKEQISSLVIIQESYLSARETVIMYEAQVKLLQGVVRSWEQRREMLIQYGADNRKAWDQTKKMHVDPSLGQLPQGPPSFTRN